MAEQDVNVIFRAQARSEEEVAEYVLYFSLRVYALTIFSIICSIYIGYCAYKLGMMRYLVTVTPDDRSMGWIFWVLLAIWGTAMPLMEKFNDKLNAFTMFFLYVTITSVQGLIITNVFNIFAPESLMNILLITISVLGLAVTYGYLARNDPGSLLSIMSTALIVAVFFFLYDLFFGSSVGVWLGFVLVTSLPIIIVGLASQAYMARELALDMIDKDDEELEWKAIFLSAAVFATVFWVLFVTLLSLLDRQEL